jgi:hypothetical protein
MNQIFVIKPYKYAGTWVFDDPARDLIREPFVAGVPEMIDFVLQGMEIHNPELGFQLLFSASLFETVDYSDVVRLDLLKLDLGGAWYELVRYGKTMEGWLCPALLKYFDKPPDEIYLKAEPISHHGRLRVWAIRNPPRAPQYWFVPSVDAAVYFLLGLIEADLKNPWVEANAFGLEILENGEWAEWEDQVGDDIMARIDAVDLTAGK